MLLCKVAVIHICIYGIQLWECAKKYNVDIIHRSQNKAPREVGNPWYISNETLHKELPVKYVHNYIKQYDKIQKQTTAVPQQTNKLLNTEGNTRRLK